MFVRAFGQVLQLRAVPRPARLDDEVLRSGLEPVERVPFSPETSQQVLMRVAYSAVNRADLLQRRGSQWALADHSWPSL